MSEYVTSLPKPYISVLTEVQWWVVEGSKPTNCECGHPHYARQPDGSLLVAPQWHLCEGFPDKCGPHSLRVVG